MEGGVPLMHADGVKNLPLTVTEKALVWRDDDLYDNSVDRTTLVLTEKSSFSLLRYDCQIVEKRL
jgi:hypothetical protein